MRTCLFVFSAVVLAAAQNTLRFEVASVRPSADSDAGIPAVPQPPDGLVYINYPLSQLILNAFNVRRFQVESMPGWALETSYDITAKAAGPITEEQRRLMLRSLLVDRFKLKARTEAREQTVYVLTRLRPAGPLGPGMKPRPDCAEGAKPCQGAGTGTRVGGYIRGQAFPISQVQRMLSLVLDQVVFDETTIQGLFDVDLSWRPENATGDDSRPSLFTAVEEQLRLKLTPARRPVDMLVIESVDRPAPQ